MKKLMLMLAAVLMLAACDKENDPVVPEGRDTAPSLPANPIDKFLGEWELVITPDSVAAGDQWYSNAYYEEMTGEPNEGMHGFLTVEATDSLHVRVTSRIKFDGEDMDDYTSFYETEGALADDSTLVLADRPFTAESGLVVDMRYRTVRYGEPIVFKTEMRVMNYVYLYINELRKAQR